MLQVVAVERRGDRIRLVVLADLTATTASNIVKANVAAGSRRLAEAEARQRE